MSFGDTSDDNSSGQESTSKRNIILIRKPKSDKHESTVTSESYEISRSQTPQETSSTNNMGIETPCVNNKIFKCTEMGCSKAYSRRWQLTAHNQQDHIYYENLHIEEPVIKIAKKDSKQHKCPEAGCKAVFSRPYRLKNHIASHHGGGKPFKCNFEDCQKSYTNQSHLKRHVVIAHLDEDPTKEVICGIEKCGLIFSNKYNLKKHIIRIHQDRPFECHICHEKFRRKSLLQTHKTEIHKETAPYSCSKCLETFINFHLYQKHIKRHKTHTCDCNKTFSKWSEYLEHKKTECTVPKREYQCAICEKTFASKQNLTQHCSKIHLPDSQNNDFSCPYLGCQHSYKYKRNLNSHIKAFHEKVFEYCQCTKKDCQAVLQSKKNLKQHLRSCHSDKPLKEKVRRKPRKDKGIPKKSAAAELSGLSVSLEEHKKNIADVSINKFLKVVLTSVDGPINSPNVGKIVESRDQLMLDVISDGHSINVSGTTPIIIDEESNKSLDNNYSHSTIIDSNVNVQDKFEPSQNNAGVLLFGFPELELCDAIKQTTEGHNSLSNNVDAPLVII